MRRVVHNYTNLSITCMNISKISVQKSYKEVNVKFVLGVPGKHDS